MAVGYEKELFRVQCRILDLGTDKSLSGKELRNRLMELRQEIIDFREAELECGIYEPHDFIR